VESAVCAFFVRADGEFVFCVFFLVYLFNTPHTREYYFCHPPINIEEFQRSPFPFLNINARSGSALAGFTASLLHAVSWGVSSVID
jgi:hypothetical protein